MAHEPNSVALADSEWTLIKEFTSNPPKSVAVKNLSTSAGSAEILVMPMHVETAPEAAGTEDGWPLAPGEEKSFFDAVARGGDGRITAVYGKSSGATVHVAVDVR